MQRAAVQSETVVTELQSKLLHWEQTGAELQKKVEMSQAESMQLKSQFESAVKLKERKLQDREAHLKNVNDQVRIIFSCIIPPYAYSLYEDITIGGRAVISKD